MTNASGHRESPDRDESLADTVLLDVDGTLIDSTYFHALAWIRAFAAHDLTPDWWRVHRTVGMGGDLLVGEVCGREVEDRLGDELRADWADRYRQLLPEVRVFPGARALIDQLQQAGHRVALASSGAQEFTEAALRMLGMAGDEFAAVRLLILPSYTLNFSSLHLFMNSLSNAVLPTPVSPWRRRVTPFFRLCAGS